MHKVGELTTQEFIDLAKHIVENEFYDANPDIQGAYDVSVVWFCKTLQNKKILLCVPNVNDDKYYEVTYNGDMHEMYFDIYKKQANIKFDPYDVEYYFEGEDDAHAQ